MRISILAILLAAGAMGAQAADGLGCFGKLPMPEYPARARELGMEASVVTTVQIGADAAVLSIETHVLSTASDASTLFVAPVETAVRAARASRECAGQKVTVAFRFQKPENLKPLDPMEAGWVLQVPGASAAIVTEKERPRLAR